LPTPLEFRIHCTIHGWSPEPTSAVRRNEAASYTSTLREEAPLPVKGAPHRNWLPVFIAAALVIIVLLVIVRWNRLKST
jgi:hypothetical protein